jgi:hypothetical protein
MKNNFNLLTTHITSCTDTGYNIYKLKPSIEKKITGNLNSTVTNMKLLDSTNLSILLSNNITKPFRPNNTLVLWDDKKKSSILELVIKDTIVDAHVTKDFIIVITEVKIFIYDILTGNSHNIKNDDLNVFNKLTLSKINSTLKPYLVYLSKAQGTISILDIKQDISYNIKAHVNNITSLAFNLAATKIATTSEAGTNVHVFDVLTQKLINKYRLSVQKNIIYDLAFDYKSEILVCYTQSGLYFYDLLNVNNIKSNLSLIKDYLPEYFSSQWFYHHIKLEDNSMGSCSFDSADALHVVTQGDSYYKITKSNNKYDVNCHKLL